MPQSSDAQGSRTKKLARFKNRDDKDGSKANRPDRTANDASLDVTEARIEHEDWTTGDVYIM